MRTPIKCLYRLRDRGRQPGVLAPLLALLLVLSGGEAAMAQTKPFSTDQALFLQEVGAFMTEADRKEGRAFVEGVFAPAWNGTWLNERQRLRVVEVANAMLKKRFEAFPYFRDFLATVAAFPAGGRKAEEFDAWMRAMEDLVAKGRKQHVAAFIATCSGLFRDGTLFSSASTTWVARGGKFSFAYDTVPSVVFSSCDLVCRAKGDSAVVLNTTGTYLPSLELWKGRGGRVTWERAGLKPTATFAEWEHPYQIRIKGSTFEVDSVRFNDPYFVKAMLGKLSEKVLANMDGDKASYPRFFSYDRRIKIRDIADGIDFEGGFTMQGAKLQGYGTRDEPAFLTFYRDKRPFIRARGVLFSIESGRITSDDVAVLITLEKDSLHHPSVSMRFLKDKRQLSLIRKEEGLSKSPFYNSYHQMDMYFEVLTWKQGDPLVQMGNLPGSAQTRASFESFDYYRDKRYMGMIGVDAVHPLVRVNDFAKKNGDLFQVQDFAVHARMQKQNVVPMMIDLANKGYVEFDAEGEMVRVLPRLRQHILNNAGKQDYDALQINSNSDDHLNATINLLNMDLGMRGVARIVLSDSQDVRILPSQGLVTMKKGRDFTFGGVVQAGRLTFHGKEYFFHYDKFTVDLLNVDSVAFMATSFEKNEKGEHTLVRVKNVLEQVTGNLEIDHPTNKSGRQQEKYPAYPKFHSTKESFVFYDKKTIQRGVYGRDKFYYRSDPFTIDSLDNFTNEGLTFTGTLVCGGIFPDIREPLRLQPDYSLGFVRSTGGGGMPLYGKKATFTDTLVLNARGLQGRGRLDFLTTTLRSKGLVFCPDSTIGRADSLFNKPATSPSSVPEVRAGDVYVRLEPARDVLRTEKLRKPLLMFGGQADLHGATELSPQGMSGAGLVDFRNATLESSLFAFERMKVHADTSDFRLTDGDISSIAFKTDNVNATVKLDERVGEFVSNGNETKVEFPVNQYICYMDRFKWFMDQGDIELESDRTAAAASEDLQLSGSNFISIRPDQDSLAFMAPKARYDLRRHLITATDVQYIRVADALITPDSMVVRVRRNAEMDPLKNAVVTANVASKYHRITEATVRIAARRSYTGSGTIAYTDENDRQQAIALHKLAVDSTYQTYAEGRIAADQDFRLSPAFDFAGDVFLKASEKLLTFSGRTRIQHGCDKLARAWVGFRSPIDPQEVLIPIADTLYDDRGRRIRAGILLTDDDPYIVYPLFLGNTRDEKDRPVASAHHLLTYDKGRKEYVIGPLDKIRQRNLPGDLVTLAVENCLVAADGRFNPGTQLGRINLISVGGSRFEQEGEKATFSGVMLVDLHMLDNALERMASEILAYPEQKQVDITKTYYEKMLREVLGLERSDKLISELSLKGEIKRLPDELVKSLVLADVRMRWDGPEQSWVSEGEIGVATILKKPVYRYVKGKVHLERKRSGDIMTILLMLDDQTYWFFQYTRNQLFVYSSDQTFNTMIAEVKDDKRKLDTSKDQAPYQYLPGTKRRVEDFRERFGMQ
jgi:hypothetical protein